MKKLVLLLLLLSAVLQAQIVNIPDPVFKAKLLSANATNGVAQAVFPPYMISIDTNNDGEIQVAEALNVGTLNLSNSGIASLEGISSFSNLKYLICNDNSLTTLDVTSLTQLLNLNCRSNQLQSLLFNNLPLLTDVDCSTNQLSELNLQGLPSLIVLLCSANLITSLDLEGKPALKMLKCTYIPQLSSINNISGAGVLEQLECTHNGLTSLDISMNPTLKFVDVSYGNITTLTVGDCPNLESLVCNTNAISSLDVSGCPKLGVLQAYDNLLTSLDVNNCLDIYLVNVADNPIETLFLKNGGTESVVFGNNPNLSYICGDEGDFLNLSANLGPLEPYNIVVNSYCSFVPGGTYNTITGHVQFDGDNNGCSPEDPALAYSNLTVGDGVNNYLVATNSLGGYTFYTQAGTFTMAVEGIDPSIFTVSFPDQTVGFPNSSNNTMVLDVCVTPNGVHHDVEVVIAPLGVIRPGFDASYTVTYRNKGNQVENGQVNFQFDDDKLDVVSTSQAPANSTTGSLSWNFTGLLPYESRTIIVTVNANSPVETPAVNIGDIMTYNSSVTLLQTDENPGDNAFAFLHTVVGSYDPNDITCLEGNIVSPSLIGKYLHYHVNFENTGNYPAENVVVRMKMDASKFDMASLQFMGSSHQPRVQRKGDLVEFIFEGIQLQPEGKGYVLFKIKTKNTLVTGNSVSQKADIYFDFNAPVATNTATTTFEQLSTVTPSAEAFVLWPNPASDVIMVSGASDIETISILNLLGQEVGKQAGSGRGTQVNISSLPAGNYLVRVKAAGGEQLLKLVKK